MAVVPGGSATFVLIAVILVLWAVCVFTDADGQPLLTLFGTDRERLLHAELHRLRAERLRRERAWTPSGWRVVGEAKAADRAAKKRAEREP